MKRFLVRLVAACVALLILVGSVEAQQAWRVVRAVRLLSASGARIKTLHPPEIVTQQDSHEDGDYIEVVDGVGDLGWAYKPYLTPATAAETPTAEGAEPVGEEEEAPPSPPASGAVVNQLSTSWAKPAPNNSHFTNVDGEECGPTGSGGDLETNRRKNRTDMPSSYHEVTFTAVDGLTYPTPAPKHRADWSAAQLTDIARYEGVALTVTGYLVAIKPQTSGSGEYCNCRMTRAAETDWHMALVGERGGGESEAMVVETTPRIRRDHPKWTKSRLSPWVDSDNQVRISGWLMLDPEHRNHLGKYRNTLWEIHPITKIEVMLNGTWVDLDQLGAGPS